MANSTYEYKARKDILKSIILYHLGKDLIIHLFDRNFPHEFLGNYAFTMALIPVNEL